MQLKKITFFPQPFIALSLLVNLIFMPVCSFAAEPVSTEAAGIISSVQTPEDMQKQSDSKLVEDLNHLQDLQQSTASTAQTGIEDLKKGVHFLVGYFQYKLGNDFTVVSVLTGDADKPYEITVRSNSLNKTTGSFESLVISSDRNFSPIITSVKYTGIWITDRDVQILKEVAGMKGMDRVAFIAKCKINFMDGDHSVHFAFQGKDEVAYRYEGTTYVNSDLSKAWRQMVREAKGILADDYAVMGYQIGNNDVIRIKRKAASSPQERQLEEIVLLIDIKSKNINISWADYTGSKTINSEFLQSVLTQLSADQTSEENEIVALARMQVEAYTSSELIVSIDDHRYRHSLDETGKILVEELSPHVLPATYDVALKIGEDYKIFGPASNDLERGDLLREAVRQMKAGDTLMLGEGRFDCDAKTRGVLAFPDHVTVIGKGTDKTHLFSNSWSDIQGAAFQVRNGNFSDLTFENQTWQTFEDGRTIEMYDGYKRTPDNLYFVYDANGRRVVEEANVGPFTATFDRVKFIGNSWVVYDWSARGHTWIIRDSAIVGGRQGVSMMSSGGHAQNAYILRTTFDIDTMRSMDIGETSNVLYGGAYGVVARGGNIVVEDCFFNIKGGQTPHRRSYAPRAVGVYDGNDFDTASSSHTSIQLINNRWSIDGNGAADTYDIFMTNESVKNNLQVSGGSGSGPGGLISKNWTASL